MIRANKPPIRGKLAESDTGCNLFHVERRPGCGIFAYTFHVERGDARAIRLLLFHVEQQRVLSLF